MKGKLGLPQEGPSYTDKNVYRESSAQPSPKGTPVFYQVTVHWWGGNTQTFWGQCPFPGHWLWTDTNSDRTKMSLWPTSQRRDLRVSGLTQVHPPVGPVRPQTHPVVLFPVPGGVIGIEILSSRRDRHICSLTCGMRDITVESAKCEPLELLYLRKWWTQSIITFLRDCRA